MFCITHTGSGTDHCQVYWQVFGPGGGWHLIHGPHESVYWLGWHLIVQVTGTIKGRNPAPRKVSWLGWSLIIHVTGPIKGRKPAPRICQLAGLDHAGPFFWA